MLLVVPIGVSGAQIREEDKNQAFPLRGGETKSLWLLTFKETSENKKKRKTGEGIVCTPVRVSANHQFKVQPWRQHA